RERAPGYPLGSWRTREVRYALDDDEGDGHPPEHGVGTSGHHGEGDIGVIEEYFLDLTGKHLLPTPIDDIILTPSEEQVPLVVAVTEVTGIEPTTRRASIARRFSGDATGSIADRT